MKPDFLQSLLNPGKSYRPVPFWSWNERLSTDETRRQIAEMENVGIGGYFMHARGGLQTEYMGDEWMSNVAAGVDEARNRGMEAWAYDENGWPSGFGDGAVNGLGEQYQQKYLRMSEGPRDSGPRDISRLAMADGRTLTFHYDVNPFYVDTLDPEVTRLFLENIYEPYSRRFATDFGKAMPGFFTDEPQVSRNGIPWSLIMPGRYQEAYGEDLLPLLPELFLEVGNFRRTRYRFWKLVQELFVTGFTEQICVWLESHGGRLTGHMVMEETLHSQLTSNGAVMPHYEFFHIPGMDWLCRAIDPPTTPLQVASVAHQLGKPDILSETFALTGWNVTFEELKWMFEWQMVRGITRLCQHLEGYSLRGIRKRDYPPSLFYQQPWWKDDYKPFNDAMSRIGMLLSVGKVAFEVLVIHPQSSAWMHYDDSQNPGMDQLNRDFMAVIVELESGHVPFHLGDERIMLRHGVVADGTIVVGSQTYHAVVVPSVDTLDSHTVALLREFAAGGGVLLWAGRQPQFMEGAPSGELEALVGQGRPIALDALVQSLPDSARSVCVTDAEGRPIGKVAVTRRDFTAEGAGFDGRFYYLANADDATDYPALIRVPGCDVRELDILSGELRSIAFSADGEGLVIEHLFHRRGSLCLLVSDLPGELPRCDPRAESAGLTPLTQQELQGEWELELLDPNSFTLDYCDIWFDGKLIAEREHISVVQSRALALERPVDIAMRFEIPVAPGFTPGGDIFVVMEQPELYGVELNGEAVPTADEGMYRDTAFRRVRISGRLRPGLNELWLRLTFTQSAEVYENLRKAAAFESEKNKLTYDTEVEAIYLVGDFGVATEGPVESLARGATRYSGGFTIGPLPKVVQLGDLTYQGLPFFNGTLRLSKLLSLTEGSTAGRSFELGRAMAQVVKLEVNGKQTKTWYWRPYAASAEGLLSPGENSLQLTLTSGLRNLLGPHHMQEGESYAVGPHCFFKEPNIWGNAPWSDAYCFVEFGVSL